MQQGLNPDGSLFTTTRWRIGDWLDHERERDPVSFPPHDATGRLPKHEVPLHIVWADALRTVPVAVRDYDGCEAQVLGPA